jgi:hemoglobin
MRKAHKHLDVNEKDFNVIAGHLQTTLKELKVDPKLIAEVMVVAGSTKDAVLNTPTKKK